MITITIWTGLYISDVCSPICPIKIKLSDSIASRASQLNDPCTSPSPHPHLTVTSPSPSPHLHLTSPHLLTPRCLTAGRTQSPSTSSPPTAPGAPPPLALESREPASLARRQFACPQTIVDYEEKKKISFWPHKTAGSLVIIMQAGRL